MLGDGALKVFFNASECDKQKEDSERNFFRFLRGESADDDFTRMLKDREVKKTAHPRKAKKTTLAGGFWL